MPRKKNPLPSIALALTALSVGAAGVWGLRVKSGPTVDMSSVDAMDGSVRRIQSVLSKSDSERLEKRYRSRRGELTLAIIKQRLAGEASEFHGMPGAEFLAALDRDWAAKSGERGAELKRVIQEISNAADLAVKGIEGEFDAAARNAAGPEEVDRARSAIKKRVEVIRAEEAIAIQKAREIAK